MHHPDHHSTSPYNPTTEPIVIQAAGVAYTAAQPVNIQPGTSVHVFTTGPSVGPDPCTVTCHVCGETGLTRAVKGPGTRTHLIALGLCVVGCWPCVPCVYCVDACLCTKHFCGKCNTYIGIYNPQLF